MALPTGWKEIGLYTAGDDMSRVWRLFSPHLAVQDGFQLYTRPIDDVEETRCDDFDIMLFHGAFSHEFRKCFIQSVATNPKYACYVSGSSTINGRRVGKIDGLGWTVIDGC